ncbi:MAG TPA: Rne/Rng family ribonuclease [Paracoccaceae bacterium]|nr:Rne/Rng family ribonuclease [Paracoccaceae bacterium]
MPKKMLIDATHPEETRVVVVEGNKVEEFDFESINKRQIAGNIYLAKVTRVEPSLQAAFVDYGGNRHGFLAFAEIHPDYYQIPVADRERLLAEQAAAEGREEAEEEERFNAKRRRRPGRDRGRRGAETADRDPAEEGAEAPVAAEAEAELGTEGPSEPQAVSEEAPAETPEAAPTAADSPAAPTFSDAPPAAEAAAPEPAAEIPAAAAVAEAGETAAAGGETSAVETAAAGGETGAVETAEPEAGIGSAETVEPEAEPRPAGDMPPGSLAESAGARDARISEAAAVPAAEQGGEDEEEAAEPAEEVESVGAEDVQDEIVTRRAPLRRYKIQEVIKVRQIMLVQVVKEERGNKGAALTTYLSLAGRYCVLMPNTARGGGISRKITNAADRKKLKEIAGELDVPKGLGLIIRTAGAERTKAEIKRDYEYLIRLWDEIRDVTLRSIAPALIYEEGSLIKRCIRDLFSRDIDEVLVEGEQGYRDAREYMKMLMPGQERAVKLYAEPIPLFSRYQVESYLAAMFNPIVQLKSGGYIVIGVTEALVAIDVNSGRATREHSIEETALKTNLEAADEIARQLRLRDLAGLIVIDFIDMEERRNNIAVEKRLKERLKSDRARIQIGRISAFGLLEMSRQRLRPGMLEASTAPCPHCHGTGLIRSGESLALTILREIEEEGVRQRSKEVLVTAPVSVANYLINQKRDAILRVETRYGLSVRVEADPALVSPEYRMERFKVASRTIGLGGAGAPITVDSFALAEDLAEEAEALQPSRKRRRRRKRRGGVETRPDGTPMPAAEVAETAAEAERGGAAAEEEPEAPPAAPPPEAELATEAPEAELAPEAPEPAAAEPEAAAPAPARRKVRARRPKAPAEPSGTPDSMAVIDASGEEVRPLEIDEASPFGTTISDPATAPEMPDLPETKAKKPARAPRPRRRPAKKEEKTAEAEPASEPEPATAASREPAPVETETEPQSAAEPTRSAEATDASVAAPKAADAEPPAVPEAALAGIAATEIGAPQPGGSAPEASPEAEQAAAEAEGAKPKRRGWWSFNR